MSEIKVQLDETIQSIWDYGATRTDQFEKLALQKISKRDLKGFVGKTFNITLLDKKNFILKVEKEKNKAIVKDHRNKKTAFTINIMLAIIEELVNNVKEQNKPLYEKEILVYEPSFIFQLSIPQENVWELMKEFGKTFAEKWEGPFKNVQTVDYALNDINTKNWRINVVVEKNDENKFYDFLKQFCEERNLSFKDPRSHKE